MQVVQERFHCRTIFQDCIKQIRYQVVHRFGVSARFQTVDRGTELVCKFLSALLDERDKMLTFQTLMTHPQCEFLGEELDLGSFAPNLSREHIVKRLLHIFICLAGYLLENAEASRTQNIKKIACQTNKNMKQAFHHMFTR